MKFQSKFGIGEIVLTHQVISGDRVFKDLILRVKDIIFCEDGTIMYHCREPQLGHMIYFNECELIGDPLFDQDTGAYPVEE